MNGRIASANSVEIDPKRTSAGSKSCSAACPVVASWTASLPRIPHRAGAGVGGGVRGKLAVEFCEKRNAIGEAKLGAGGGERGIFCRRCAVDDEARPRKHLERGRERRIAHPVVRPGHTRAQGERGLRIEQ